MIKSWNWTSLTGLSSAKCSGFLDLYNYFRCKTKTDSKKNGMFRCFVPIPMNNYVNYKVLVLNNEDNLHSTYFLLKSFEESLILKSVY